MATATGTFEISSMGEDAYHEVEGEPKLARANGAQRFTGDLEGEGSVEWLVCYLPDGGARFTGFQRIEGSIGGRAGSFVAEATADHDGTQSKGTWTIIAGSGAGELSAIAGTGTFEAFKAGASYSLGYQLG
jgi:hypothetical protein